MNSNLEAVLRYAIEHRCRPSIDDIDCQNIMTEIDGLRARVAELKYQINTEVGSGLQIANEQLKKQNRQLKEALIGWRQQAWPVVDQRAVIEKDFPEIK